MRVAHINMSELHLPTTTGTVLGQQHLSVDRQSVSALVMTLSSSQYMGWSTTTYVCGRAVGYSFYNLVGFYWGADQSNTIDQEYLSGLFITHGVPGSRHQIWSYAAGWREDILHVYN